MHCDSAAMSRAATSTFNCSSVTICATTRMFHTLRSAKEFDLDPATVNNYLAAARRDFRRVVLEKLREITATDEEFRTEARSLLGVDVK